MRRWGFLLAGLVALNLGAAFYWHRDEGITHPENFENLDTRIIVENLQQPHSPWQWFTGDWVLGNGFYRPFPSLLYELDYALWGTNLLAYKWTNGALALLCALGVVWFVYELSKRRWLALASGFVFTLWQTGLLVSVPELLAWLALAGSFLWGLHKNDWRWGIATGCLLFAGIQELGFIPTQFDIHMASFSYRAVGWIPGRTATLMTLFALIALASYCRYCWTGRMGWGILSLLGLIGALGSHEGAVALPFLMALCGFAVAKQGGRFYKWVLVGAIYILVLYAWVYLSAIPFPSDYQMQRVKRYKTVSLTLANWLVPPSVPAWMQMEAFRSVPTSVFLPIFWGAMLVLVIYLVAMRGLFWRKPASPVGHGFSWVAVVGWLGSVIAYLPMMVVLPLMHYYYLPAVFRAVWASTLLTQGILELCQPTLRPTKRAILVAMGDDSYLKRSSPP